MQPGTARAVATTRRVTNRAIDRPPPSVARPFPFPPPSSALRACVVVPARDEEADLPDALTALAGQVDRHGRPLDREQFEVIVLANNCRDRTAERVRAFGRAAPGLALHVVERTFPAGEAHIGRARRWLMDVACERLLAVGAARGVIASTDADTRVDPAWLAATLREVEIGADAVCGRILSPPTDGNRLDSAARRYQLRDAAYRLLVAELEAILDPDPADPWPRHHQHFGASLAVTAGTYRAVGGLPPMPALEDMAFHDALRRIDARVRHSPAVRVVTSPRRSGRVAIGLSTQLGEWAAMARAGEPLLVEAPSAVEERLRRERLLRGLWRRTRTVPAVAAANEAPTVAGVLGVEAGWLVEELAGGTSFGHLSEQVAERRRARLEIVPSLVEVQSAITALRRLVAELRSAPPTDGARTSPPAALLPTLQQIEPVRLPTLAAEVPEAALSAGFGQEPVVDLVAG